MTTTPQRAHDPAGSDVSAHLLPRIGARLIDALLLAGLGGAAGGIIGFGPGWLALQTVIVFAYFVLLDTMVGTTVGKRILGLAVTGADNPNPTMRQAAVREAFTLVGAIPFAGPPLAAIAWIAIVASMNASPTGQGIHDRLAGGTQVVRA